MKIFTIISLITFFVLISPQIVEAQVFEWVKGINDNSNSGVEVGQYAISTDAAGNSYITGYFRYGTAIFGTTQLTWDDGGYGGGDIFIAKYDNSGNCLWAQKAGGTGDDVGFGISIDGSGNSYITGYFSGTATFGTTALTGNPFGHNIFIAKYDNAGNCLWALMAGGVDVTDLSRGSGISADAAGNSCYITGSFRGAATFGTTTLTSYGQDDIFIAKYDNAGTCLWARKAGGTGYDAGFGISIDGYGNSYITGCFSGTATFGTIILISDDDQEDNFIAKYDIAGTCLWAREAGGGTYYVWPNGISTDAIGNSYIKGYFSVTATFGSTITLTGGYDVNFIAKYDNAGICLWARKIEASANTIGSNYKISTDANGNSYITGCFSETATFGAFPLQSYGGYDIFIAKYDNAGVCSWALNAGGSNDDEGFAISASANGYIYVTGWSTNPANFGSISLNNNYEGFIAKIADAPLPPAFSCGTSTVTYPTSPSAEVHVYNTVKIGSQCWLKENLDIGTRINGNLDQANNDEIEKYCYNNANVDGSGKCLPYGGLYYGGLYQWAEALQYKNGATNSTSPNPAFTGNIQGICPTGWHIPTQTEFNTLATTVNNDGNALKAIGQGVLSGVGTNTSGFSALLAGFRFPGYFSGTDTIALFWSTGELSAVQGYDLHLLTADSYISWSNYGKVFGLSVRCLKDDPSSAINDDNNSSVPTEFYLRQNYPNPFNPTTKIEYTLPSSGLVKLQVFSVTGEIVKTLVDEHQDAGYYSVDFSGTDLASGMYFYRLSVNSKTIVKKMLYLK